MQLCKAMSSAANAQFCQARRQKLRRCERGALPVVSISASLDLCTCAMAERCEVGGRSGAVAHQSESFLRLMMAETAACVNGMPTQPT